MSLLDSLIYGFSSILSFGPELPREGDIQDCCGAIDGGCCKDESKPSCCASVNPGCPSKHVRLENFDIVFSPLAGAESTGCVAGLKSSLESSLWAESSNQLTITDIATADLDRLLTSTTICAFVVPNDSNKGLFDRLTNWIQKLQMSKQTTPLKNFRYAVYGLGDPSDKKDTNTTAQCIDVWLDQLGATRISQSGIRSRNTDQRMEFDQWTTRLIARLQDNPSLTMTCNALDFVDKCKHNESSTNVTKSANEMMDVEDMSKLVTKFTNTKDGSDGKDNAVRHQTSGKGTKVIHRKRQPSVKESR